MVRRAIMFFLLAFAVFACAAVMFACGGECDHANVTRQVVREATCTTEGEVKYTCEDCGDVRVETLDALGHDLDEGEVTLEATCTTEGRVTYVCRRAGCDYTTEDTIAPLGHDLDEGEVTLEATCTTEGVLTHSCTRCDATEDETIAPLGHDMKTRVVEATCTTSGYTLHYCDRDGCDEERITDEVRATGHELDDGVVTKAATCLENGTLTRSCTHPGCSYTETSVIPATDHNLREDVVPATCLTAGYTRHTCTNPGCEYYYDSDDVAPLGHLWNVEQPTCTTGQVCTRKGCDATGLPAVAHDYEVKSVTPATCTKPEVTIYECPMCPNEWKTETGAPLGHAFGEYVAEGEPVVDGCERTVTMVAHCTREGCDVKDEKTEVAVLHTYSGSITRAATCTTEGEKTYVCGGCGDSYTETYSDPDAHKWVEDADGRAADGTVTYHCEYCDAVKTTVSMKDQTTATVSASTLADAGEIELKDASIAMDDTAKTALSGMDDVTVSASALTDEDVAGLGIDVSDYDIDKVYDFTMTSGDTPITSFNDGTVTVRIPYELAEGEDPDNIAVLYIDDEGKISEYAARYVNGYAVFETKHFSYYTVTRLTPAQRCAIYGHVTDRRSKEATCVSAGYEMTVCTRCGEIVERNDIPATGHDFQVTYRGEATCTVDGSTTYSCRNAGCNFSYTVRTPATGHSWKITNSVAASCAAPGYTEYGCVACGEKYTVTIAQKSHSFAETVIPATCTESGHTVGECRNCGMKRVYDVTSPLGHDYVTTVVPPTCTVAGHTSHVCRRCAYSYNDTEVPATGHDWNIPVATCGEDQVCEVCGAKGMIATGEHTYGPDGVCEVCGAGCMHVYGATTVVPATCEAGGRSYHTCSKCGKTEYFDYTDPLGHDYEAVRVVPPTCDAGGYTVYECTRCDAGRQGDHVAALGHAYDYDACMRCGEKNPAYDRFFLNMFESIETGEWVIRLDGVRLTDVQENYDAEGNAYDSSETYYEIDLPELYVSIAADGTLGGYGEGTVTMYSNAAYDGTEDVYTARAVIENNTAYVIADSASTNTAVGITEPGERLYITADASLLTEVLASVMGSDVDYADFAYMLGLLKSDVLPMLNGFLSVNGEDVTRYADSLLSRLFVHEISETGYVFTLDAGLLDTLNVYMDTRPFSETIDYLLGEGTFDSLEKTTLDALDSKVADVLEMLSDGGLDHSDILSVVSEAYELVTGKPMDMEADLFPPEALDMTLADYIVSMTHVFEDGERLISETESGIDRFRASTLYEMLAGSGNVIAEQFDKVIDSMRDGANPAFETSADGTFVGLSLVLSDTEYVYSSYSTDNGVLMHEYRVVLDGGVTILPNGVPAFDMSDVADEVRDFLADMRVADGTTVTDGSSVLTFVSDDDGNIVEVRRTVEEGGRFISDRYEGVYNGRPCTVLKYGEVLSTTYVYDLSGAHMIIASRDCGDRKRVMVTAPRAEFSEVMYALAYMDGDVQLGTSGPVTETEKYDVEYVYLNDLVFYYDNNAYESKVQTTSAHVYELNEQASVVADECGEVGYDRYECVNPGCDSFYLVYNFEHHEYAPVSATLMSGSEDCSDGVKVTYACSKCGDEYTLVETGHVAVPERAFTHDCGDTLTVLTCACGRNTYVEESGDGDYAVGNYGRDEGGTYHEYEMHECVVNEPYCGFAYVIDSYSTSDEECREVRHTDILILDREEGEQTYTVLFRLPHESYTGDRKHTTERTKNDLRYDDMDRIVFENTRYECTVCGNYYEENVIEREYDADGEIKYTQTTEVIKDVDSYKERVSYIEMGYEYGGLEFDYHSFSETSEYANGESTSNSYAYLDYIKEYEYNGEPRVGIAYSNYLYTQQSDVYASGTRYDDRTEYDYDFENCRRTVTTYDKGRMVSQYEEEWHLNDVFTVSDGCSRPEHELTYCMVEDKVLSDNAVPPSGHFFGYDDDKGVWVCDNCGLESDTGINGDLILEDYTGRQLPDGSTPSDDDYIISYYNGTGNDFIIHVSAIWTDDYGMRQQTDLGSEFAVFDENIEDLVRISKADVAAAAAEMLPGLEACEYAVRVSFVPVGGSSLDYAITFDVDHNYVLDEDAGVTPTKCGEYGTHVYVCTVCGDTYDVLYTIADSHDYVLDESRSNLTDVCDEEYVEVLVCANCGDELVTRYTVEHDTVFHVYDLSEYGARCGISELTYNECTKCGKAIDRTFRCECNMSETVVEDVTENGHERIVTSYECADCGFSYELTRDRTLLDETTCLYSVTETYVFGDNGTTVTLELTEQDAHKYETVFTEPVFDDHGNMVSEGHTDTCTVCGQEVTYFDSCDYAYEGDEVVSKVMRSEITSSSGWSSVTETELAAFAGDLITVREYSDNTDADGNGNTSSVEYTCAEDGRYTSETMTVTETWANGDTSSYTEVCEYFETESGDIRCIMSSRSERNEQGVVWWEEDEYTDHDFETMTCNRTHRDSYGNVTTDVYYF